jgi:hypothetical protein
MNIRGMGWIVCLVAGMAGGAISDRLLTQSEAWAEKSPPQKRVVTAEDFHLVDRSGKMRGALFVSAKGEPGFALFDQEGKNRLLLMLDADGSAVLDLKDKREQSRARVALSAEGEPEITLLDKEKRIRWKAP